MKLTTNAGTEFLLSVRHYLTGLMEKQDFAGVISFYEDNREELNRSGSGYSGVILSQVARAYVSVGSCSVALKCARMAQNLLAADGDTPELAEVFLTLGTVLRDMGELKEAEKALRDAESIFRRNDRPEGQSRALNQLGGLLFKQNQFSNALSILLDAVVIARDLDDPKMLAYMMGNIGRIHTFTGNFAKAQKHIRINIDLSTRLGDRLEQARALMSLGYVLVQQGEYTEAETALNEAESILGDLGAERDLSICMAYRGELLYRDGRFDDSELALGEARKLAHSIANDSTLEARIERHMAELKVRQSQYRQAERLVARATAIMKKAENKVELAALCKLNAVIAAATGSHEEGRRLFVLAIDLCDDARVRFEKADTLAAAGMSEVFQARQRLTYLFRAEEYYRTHGMPQRCAEIQHAISSIDYPGRLDAISSACSRVTEITPAIDYLTNCPSIVRFKEQLPVVGQSNLPILLTGETGVGKDHLARYYHSLVRPDGPMVAINCASVPEALLESELFGYRKGAFTGADSNKKGRFAAADKGVLFLDEIGDMPAPLQAKLLGVLEQRVVTPLGTTQTIPIDVKLIAATNCNLVGEVNAGRFRRDLYYRLSGLTFDLPPLRQRKEDIPLLLDLFAQQLGLVESNDQLPVELVRRFVECDWPGNIRELHNKVRRLKVMVDMASEGDLVELAHAIFEAPDERSDNGSLFQRLEQFERQMLVEALLSANGNKSEAARILGIHEATVRTKLKRYGIAAQGGVPS